jgi:iron complex transport system ATP-binding protein
LSISISNLCYRIGAAILLDDISVEIKKGLITAVVGPNGSGKTSLTKVTSGEVRASSGSVTVEGQDIQSLSLEERARRLAVLPQESALDFPFTVQEVVQMGRIPHLTSMETNWQIVEEVLLEMQLEQLRLRIYPTLSGGEKQRVQIARVLCQVWDVREHACLFLDEPTAALDLSHQIALFNTLVRLRNDGLTVLVVLHDINLALRYAEQVVLLSSGHLQASGAPLDVLNQANLQDVFNVRIEMFATSDASRPFILARD